MPISKDLQTQKSKVAELLQTESRPILAMVRLRAFLLRLMPVEAPRIRPMLVRMEWNNRRENKERENLPFESLCPQSPRVALRGVLRSENWQTHHGVKLVLENAEDQTNRD